ncbi:cryptochrome/photolyase family protein [uncultured Cocleimonas sp.]|uniref:cryptochrome/photolyase family protein n=1 Tax=uncultured Cocleimonas sp. TaxID=1051587 RepID=UPI002632A86E|nr:cryptochrome/photolyase family protein [uncultured Cocleimonas sp.]
MRRLYVILGDQLDHKSLIFDDVDKQQDCFWMAEVKEEATHVWSHKQRIALFLSAMRHFAESLKQRDLPLHYLTLNDHDYSTLAEALGATIKEHNPESVWLVRPGDYRVFKSIAQVCKQHDVELKQLHDQHFLSTPSEFKQWTSGKKQVRLEYWYRELRKKYHILMEDDKHPLGGKWNYDQSNRKSFNKDGPQDIPKTIDWKADKITTEVITLVNDNYPDHPGELEQLEWPVTPEQAQQALDRFLDECLQNFGDYQDAMWTDEPFLNHSLISSSLNLKLLHPLDVINAAETYHREKGAPLAAVEGFIRQILGWREYVRGLYWLNMPDWLEMNGLQANNDLPDFYWTGETDMNCLHQSIKQTLKYGYAHHIQRLMITGLFSLIYGVKPKQIHEWYLAVYVDAVEWVELPNTLGMSQYVDNGIMASKPYAASANYINKMSNYCKDCRFKPSEAIGDNACPFTTLFWDFLDKHEADFANNPRMGFMLKNLRRKSDDDLEQIKKQAAAFRENTNK